MPRLARPHGCPPGEELVRAPRPIVRARIGAAAFTVLLVITLVAPVVIDAEAMPGLSLIALGNLLLMGFAELIDASSRGFLLAVRLGGVAIALLGLVVLLL
ncbi:hypothetical protein [Brachybacterium vulturis]|uniref:hypothetical protein n=1 Tax=Brachybacterium vulturis TaxID=2017484 RepID=UPI0037355BD8